MFSAVTSFFTNLVYKNYSPMNMADVDKILKDAERESIETSAVVTEDLPQQIGECCFYATGIVTAIRDEYVLIDNKYLCDIHRVAIEVKIGNKVRYLAYQLDKNKELKIHKIIDFADSTWDDDDDDNNEQVLANLKATDSIVKGQMMNRTLVGKVMRREGRIVFIEPHNITFNLDNVRSEFIPIAGDWVNISSLVEVSADAADLNGEVLEVDSISPLRSNLHTGTITKYDVNTGVGNIDRTTIFTKTVCEPGYVPCEGDKIVTDSIESDQGPFAWRSLTIVPLSSNNKNVNNDSNVLRNDEVDKNEMGNEEEFGLIVTKNLELTLEMHQEREIEVKIENKGFQKQALVKCCFLSKKMESQLILLSPNINDRIVLQPGEEIAYKFLCKSKFLGLSREKFLFIFERAKVIRTFHIKVQPKQQNVHRGNFFNGGRKDIVARQDVHDDTGYIHGIRPCKAPNFIAVRSGIFKIPQICWSLVLDAENNRYNSAEREHLIGHGLPCLVDSLTMQNYRNKFHNLLYLEEISQNILMQRYDMESAILAHCGEFLSLTVPGLAEKRPSLIFGDKVIVSFKWDSSKGNIKYEGFIHKVRSCEVLLKFNPKFHDDYSGEDCQVSFKGSNSTIRRCHDAINLAVNHLGQEFLFPNKVNEKAPQFHITEIEERNLTKAGNNHKRNESVSSNCSTVSNVDSSSVDSEIRSPPRVSVVERLFNTKPCSPVERNDLEFIVSRVQSSNKYDDDDNKKLRKNLTNDCKKNGTSDMDRRLEKVESELRKRKLTWYNKRLNIYQRRAVLNILKGYARPLPYVIFGPPGTGKTITLCEAVLQILTTISNSRLMIATPSNSSANLIAERLLDSGVLKPGDMVRLVAHHYLEEGKIPERLIPYCATGTLQEERSGNQMKIESTGFKTNCTASVLGRHRITIGTCSALGIIYNMGLARGHFTHILVDEAGQATEPEIMIPLTFVHADTGQVILAGDPMQLGPVVQCKYATHFGLGESFLSRLLQRFPYQRDPQGFETGYDPRLITKLLINYRSLPEILKLPNSLFYDSELIPELSSDKSNEAKLLSKLAADLPERSGLPPAIVFHGVNGNNYQFPDSPSWYNPEEATQVYFYLLKLFDRGLCADDIGIITPYQSQIRQIKDLLLEMEMELPKVGSVEEFQGQERNVIILSTVRSTSDYVNEDIRHALGFVASPRRLNVAITRSRALLIIIGNPYLLNEDPYWRTVLNYCLERDSYTGCSISRSVPTFDP